MLKNSLRIFLIFCCIVLAVTPFCGISASAAVLETEFPGASVPQEKNYTWSSVTSVISTKKMRKYFIIRTDCGGHSADLYLSFPKEGGFRLQTLHEFQKAEGITSPPAGNNGLFEPEALETVHYANDSGALLLYGGGDTVIRYTAYGKGFELQIRNSEEKRIISITHLQISFAYDRKGTVVRSMVELPLMNREAIYGGGERFNDANQVGHTISLTNFDCWSRPEYSYKNVPLFHSNRGYSIWFNMSYSGQADIGETDSKKYSVAFDGEKLDFYLFTGTPLENLKRYTDLTGTSGVSETWTYGFWTGAQNAAFENTGARDTLTNIKDLIEGYKSYYNFYPEACFAEGAAARNKNVTDYLNQIGVRTLGWFSPDLWRSFGTAEELLPNITEYPTFNSSGKLLSSGQPFTYFSKYFKTYGAYKFFDKNYIDFSNPNSVEMIKACWGDYWDNGVSGTMNDFGEWYPFETMYFNGIDGDEMHNLISYYYAKSANEAWSDRFGNDYVLFMRSGCAGSQYYSGDFLGDQVSAYYGNDNNGYVSTIYAMISMGASGFNLYGADLGGLGGIPSDDLWNRWVQLSVFSPYMRQHGSFIHKPWEHGDLAAKSFGSWYYFRKNIVPMIESAAIDAEKNSNPIIKGMMMAYPYQIALADVNDEYIFCDDFLVCPVTEENTTYRDIYLPKGSTWYGLSDYENYGGGNKVSFYSPTSNFPVFIKGGAVKAINVPASMQLGAEMHDDSNDDKQAIDALLITPPDNDRTSVIYNKIGQSTDYHTYDCKVETYESLRGSDSDFTVQNEEGSDRQIVLALGVAAASVTVDGQPLTRLWNTPSYANNQYGYYVEASGKGMTKILLPKGWHSINIVKGSVEQASATLFSSSNPVSLVKNNTLEVFESESIIEASKIKVMWATGFADSYDIEYSLDGESWSSIKEESSEYTVTNGAGSVDTVNCDNIYAKYFRIVPQENGDSGEPAVNAIEIYGKTDSEIYAVKEDINIWENFSENSYDIPFETAYTDFSKEMPYQGKLIIASFMIAVVFAGEAILLSNSRKKRLH